jgi:SAM-dependent methyltransferase
MDECPICRNPAGERYHQAREMMFGLRERFTYLECTSCGSLRLLDPPEDPGRFYPSEYYSRVAPLIPRRGWRFPLRRRRLEQALGRTTLPGALLARVRGVPPFAEWLRRSGTGPDDPILDFGCGRGALLLEMGAWGCRDLTGYDPLLEEDTDLPFGIRLCRQEPPPPKNGWHLVMLHHVLEHLADPETVLGDLAGRLAPGGTLLIRIPLADSHAWRTYGVDWVQLDAPRHRWLLTRCGLHVLAERLGLEVTEQADDSTSFQFWGSEQYRRDIPLHDPRSAALDPLQLFTPTELTGWETLTSELNRSGEGDQGAFYLRRRFNPSAASARSWPRNP